MFTIEKHHKNRYCHYKNNVGGHVGKCNNIFGKVFYNHKILKMVPYLIFLYPLYF